jgi:hypothetical protein
MMDFKRFSSAIWLIIFSMLLERDIKAEDTAFIVLDIIIILLNVFVVSLKDVE